MLLTASLGRALLAALPWVLLVILSGFSLFVLDRWLKLRAKEVWRQSRPPEPELANDATAVLAALRSAAIILDPDDEVISASPPAYSLGLVRGEEVTHPAIKDAINAVRRTGKIHDAELEAPRIQPGTSPLILQVRVAPIAKSRVVVFAEDRTESHRLDTIRRDFVMNISNELNEPTSAIAETAKQLSLAAGDPETVSRLSQELVTDTRRLSDLVDDLVELTRLQASGALGDVQTIHIAEVINEAIDREAKAASKKNIRVAAAGADDALVYGEHSLLVTALRNLIDNAINYSRPNTRVGIGVNEKGGFVEITVVDQGIGIGSAEQTRVFERFYRGEQARALVQQGTGLGLALVKHIAADHGGEITVWSQPNRGSTFTLKLPAADVTGVGPGAIETPGVRETPKAAKDRQNRAFTKPSPSVEKPVIADRLGETETSR